MHFKLYGKCETCPRKRFFIRLRTMYVPQLNQNVTSKKPMCDHCARKARLMIASNTYEKN